MKISWDIRHSETSSQAIFPVDKFCHRDNMNYLTLGKCRWNKSIIYIIFKVHNSKDMLVLIKPKNFSFNLLNIILDHMNWNTYTHTHTLSLSIILQVIQYKVGKNILRQNHLQIYSWSVD